MFRLAYPGDSAAFNIYDERKCRLWTMRNQIWDGTEAILPEKGKKSVDVGWRSLREAPENS
jgi:hypothetical protein